MRIIVIDDDKDLVDSLVHFLKLDGLDVVGEGYNGEDAHQLYKLHKPDIVVLDMKMPEYDGVYAIKKIKELNQNAKIIVITGYTDYEFNRNEVSAVFTKPYDIDKLLASIRKIGSA